MQAPSGPNEAANGPASPAVAETGNPHPTMRREVMEILRIEQRDRISKSLSDHIADRVTGFSGSMIYVWLHIAWFAVWILLNLGWAGVSPFDPFPFGLLTMIVSLEAIFLATFVLISQNRQSIQADRRAKIDLQIDVISEQEVSKILRVLERITDHLGISEAEDPELHEMEQITNIAQLMDDIDEAERGQNR